MNFLVGPRERLIEIQFAQTYHQTFDLILRHHLNFRHYLNFHFPPIYYLSINFLNSRWLLGKNGESLEPKFAKFYVPFSFLYVYILLLELNLWVLDQLFDVDFPSIPRSQNWFTWSQNNWLTDRRNFILESENAHNTSRLHQVSENPHLPYHPELLFVRLIASSRTSWQVTLAFLYLHFFESFSSLVLQKSFSFETSSTPTQWDYSFYDITLFFFIFSTWRIAPVKVVLDLYCS